MPEDQVLKNMEEICKVLGGIGRKRFLKLVEEGLPVRRDGYSYVGDREAVKGFWREYTSKRG
jgi:hypothetical protein